jgi:hypothetical protein
MRLKPGTYKSRELLLPQLGMSVSDENSEVGRSVVVDKLKDHVFCDIACGICESSFQI